MTASTLRDREYVAFPPRSRFLALPRASLEAARAGLALYDSVEPRQRVASVGGDLLLRTFLHRLLPSNPATGIDWTWWESWLEHVGEPFLGPEVHVTIRSRGADRRSSALFTDGRGRPRAFVKRHAEGLSKLSVAVRRRLDETLGGHVHTPRTLLTGTWHGRPFDVFEPLPAGRTRRPPRQPDRIHHIIDQVRAGLADLPRPPGVPRHHVVCHTGFTPRNLRVAKDGTWWVVDWDHVTWGPRLVYELRYWAADRAYRWRAHPERDGRAVLRLLRARGGDAEILEAARWPGHLITYRAIERDIYRAVERLLGRDG